MATRKPHTDTRDTGLAQLGHAAKNLSTSNAPAAAKAGAVLLRVHSWLTHGQPYRAITAQELRELANYIERLEA